MKSEFKSNVNLIYNDNEKSNNFQSNESIHLINKFDNPKSYVKSLNTINYVDLFAGIGGFHFAFDKYCEEEKLKAKCVLVCEIDKSAIENYSLNFKHKIDSIINIRDIEYQKWKDEVHILFAGFPCQTFSNAGKKMGFLDKVKGTLFFDILNLIDIKKPKILLLENVKHLVNHNNGETYKIIIDSLKERGYRLSKKPVIVSPKSFGIPQDRPRVYIPAIHKSILNDKTELIISPEKQEYVVGSHKNFLQKRVSEKYNVNDDLHNLFSVWSEFVNYFIEKEKKIPVIWIDEMMSKKRINGDFPDWKKKYINRMRLFYKENKQFINEWYSKNKKFFNGKRDKKLEWQAGMNYTFEESFIQLRQSGIRCRRPHTFPTLVAMVQVPIIKTGKTWRFLTPRENANIQSFPKNHLVSTLDQQAYKQYGNAVNVEVVYRLIKELINV
ncbi:MAG: DNA (cytosine-5-)-methyltransferase [Metamycoplasmataceae bacterium]